MLTNVLRRTKLATRLRGAGGTHMVLLLALLVFAAPVSAQRLSGDVIPEHYTLWFAPDLEGATFRGRDTIRVQLLAPANAITLHTSEIEFGEVTIEAAGGTQAARLGFTGAYLVAPGQQARYQDWIRTRFGPVLDALGLPGDADDSEERHSRRAELLGLVGVTGNDETIQCRARVLAAAYIADPSSLPGTLVQTVLRIAATGGDAELYDQYLARLDGLAAQPEEYYRFFAALPSFSDPTLVQRTLRYAISPAVRTQDTATLVAGLLSRAASRDAAWRFVQAEWPTLTEKLGTFRGIPSIIRALGTFCSTETTAQVSRFFATNAVASAERTLRQALERIDNCARLVALQSPALTSWLAAI